jgi:predicted phosphodiesterase
MKIRVLSDLHLRWDNYHGFYGFKYQYLGEDVLVLAGDLGEGLEGLKWIQKADIPCPIVYVPGNHEYYGQDIPILNKKFKDLTKNTFIHCCPHGVFDFEGIRFIGHPLFTDFCLDGEDKKFLSQAYWKRGLNDSTWMNRKGKNITINDFPSRYKAAVRFIRRSLNPKDVDKTVLVTHYCAEWSADPIYDGSPLNPGFRTKIPLDILNNVDVWIHGHTHSSFNYIAPNNKTRIVCNPKGYGSHPTAENQRMFDAGLILEI